MRGRGYRFWDAKRNCYAPDDDFWITYKGEWATHLYSKYSSYKGSDIIAEQSTGLPDRNGKEIYEGDIYYSTYRAGGAGSIRGKQKERIKQIVVWDDRGRWHGKRIELGRGYGCCHPNCELGENIETIGNIHENPELLEAGK